MPWMETSPMDERVKFIAAYLRRELPLTELCTAFGISRKTAYKLLKRYAVDGAAGLQDRSRRPRHSPGAVTDQVERAIVEARKRKPRWGPKKLSLMLAQDFPGLKLPALSTVGAILKRRGLTQPRRRVRRSVSPYGQPFRGYDEPNAVWCADFKGHFQMGDGTRCHPLTISDGHTRFLLRCEGLVKEREDLVREVFESAFREYGMPCAIRTDNGAPFATMAAGGLSSLSVWWIRLGITHERIEPGRPDQNGRHERMHRTLKAETAKPPRANMVAQQVAFDLFRREYNHERPHEALGQKTPASLYAPSSRLFPESLPPIVYPDDVVQRHVGPGGLLHWAGCYWYVSWCMRGETVGVREIAKDQWSVQFGPIVLGVLNRATAHPTKQGAKPYGRMLPLDPRKSLLPTPIHHEEQTHEPA
jgi:transposase InsO family protein